MKVADLQEQAQARARALDWYAGQVEVCRQCLGPRWHALEPEIVAQLKRELRDRLLALGWSVRNAR